MSEPAFDWETCRHTEISAVRVVSIVERIADKDSAVAEELKEEIHKTASGKMMARGKRRAGRHYR